MKNSLFNRFLAVISGIILGSTVNMVLIEMSGSIIPPPNGVDVTTMEGLIKALPFFETKHFLFPFLAHAGGTFIGALFSTLIAKSKQFILAMIIGCLFLLGGILNVVMLPSPLWFSLVDLILAYLPMAYLGYLIGMKIKKK
jgi:hypothetical protein